MKKQKLTPWFSPEVKPVRCGWYQTRLGPRDKWRREHRYWNGQWWSYAINRSAKSSTQDWQWRGLAEAQK